MSVEDEVSSVEWGQLGALMDAFEWLEATEAADRSACVECGIVGGSDDEEAYCPWCGCRNPELFVWLAWEELRAAEEAGSSLGASRR